MRCQSNAIACAHAVTDGNNEKKKSAVQDQNETQKLTDLFVKRFSESVPEGGEQQKMNNQQESGKSQQTGTNSPAITAETRRRILELADQTQQLQVNAAKTVEKEDFAGALPDEQKSYELLKEIEQLLPKDKNQQQQDKNQRDQKQQKQDQKQEQKQDKKQEPQPQKQEEKQEQQKEQQQEKKDATPDNVKKLLEKALQREKDHEAELQRRNQQVPPSAIDRDW